MLKWLKYASTLFVVFALAACGSGASDGGGDSAGEESGENSAERTEETIQLTVGATAVPHAEILEHVKPILAEQGVELEIKTFQDYVLPNKNLVEGELDANYFQHIPWMESSNEENGWNIVDVVGVHIEPLGAYSDKYESIEEIPDGATVAVTNASGEQDRFVRLLEANGLITLSEGEGDKTLQDIVENPKNLQFEQVENAMLPRVLPDVDLAIINTNYALEADLNPVEDALFIEGKDSPYVNVLAINEGDEDKPGIQELADALTSDDVRQFMEEKYDGAVVPAFE
ncbi:MetQ/NlpA family ABC transporter substrate-binding protein [Novibacillus thermophilus]|jgi:D-methionine transport system substrate-binding protein|uniref:Lipoprotein n=1 Tax=Novibacillus thermophilus TaxID=1471761 RepID=A0A1U9K749_9BACL|nr:MetQ/NlpA family ABC transporter substrate-binding protein [Novibacillus thermophilus]AQS55851.1 methionine ABC transporter substrate-binding protein [Novibacillus thermophilus]